MEVDIANQTDRPIDLDRWERAMGEYMLAMGLRDDTGVSVSFVDDAAIHALNLQYRQIDKPTDVLSFSHDEDGDFPTDDGMPRYLGDVILSVDTLARQAGDAGHSWDREAAVLLAHGLLHLLGYDHAEPDEEREMFAKQEELARLTLGSAG